MSDDQRWIARVPGGRRALWAFAAVCAVVLWGAVDGWTTVQTVIAVVCVAAGALNLWRASRSRSEDSNRP
jgi:hypothetical protein